MPTKTASESISTHEKLFSFALKQFEENVMGYSESDAAKDTGSTEEEATAAHHDARDDAEVRGSGKERSKEETPTKGNQAEAQAAEAKFGLS